MSGLTDSISTEMHKTEAEKRQKLKDLEALKLAKKQQSKKQGKYVKNGSVWRFETKKSKDHGRTY